MRVPRRGAASSRPADPPAFDPEVLVDVIARGVAEGLRRILTDPEQLRAIQAATDALDD